MKKLAVIVVVALCLLVAVDVVLGYFFTGLANKPSANAPSDTVAESKSRGAFVEAVTIEPSSFKWNRKQLVIREAWLEHQTELVHIYVIVPFLWEHYQYRQVEGYNLCFNLEEALNPPEDLFFVEEGKGTGFAMSGSVLLWERLDNPDMVPTKIWATDSWKLENRRELSVKRGSK
jgi:hypothetical protein